MTDFDATIPPLPAPQQAPLATPSPTATPRPLARAQKPSTSTTVLRFCWFSLVAILVLGFLALILAGIGGIVSASEELSYAFQPGSEWEVITQGDVEQCVAIYNLVGVINGQSAGAFERFVRDVVDDDQIKAFVLRVNSPGGTVSASHRIHHAVEQLKATEKPVIVSMGSVAASGGYMASCNATEIVAEPSTVTGSIGVIAQWLVLDGTLDKIGIEPVVVKSTDADYWKDDISPYHKPDARQMADLKKMLDTMQEQFNTVVREGRGDRLKPRETTLPEVTTRRLTGGTGESHVETTDLPAVEETEPFNGKVYLAPEALKLGLVDRLGYREDAIALAAEKAGLGDAHVIVYVKKSGLFGTLMSMETTTPTQTVQSALETVSTPKIMAIWQVD
jgi:protease IV